MFCRTLHKLMLYYASSEEKEEKKPRNQTLKKDERTSEKNLKATS